MKVIIMIENCISYLFELFYTFLARKYFVLNYKWFFAFYIKFYSLFSRFGVLRG